MSRKNPAKAQKQFHTLLNKGLYQQAQSCLTASFRPGAEQAGAWFQLGLAYANRQRLEDAAKCWLRAVDQQPTHVDARYNLAVIAMRQGHTEAAIKAFREILEIDRKYLGAHVNLGTLLQQSQRYDEAVSCFERLAAISPTLWDAHYNLGNAWRAKGWPGKAADCYRTALRYCQPEVADRILVNLANALQEQALHVEATEIYRQVLARQPRDWNVICGYLLGLNYRSDYGQAEIYREHFGALRVFQGTQAQTRKPPVKPRQSTRLRIGYVSPDFRVHSVAFFIRPVLAHHDQEQVAVYCYSSAHKQDEMTAALKALGHEWRDIAKLSDQEAAQLIKQDDIDVLIDLAGHTANNRLGIFVLNPAPVQLTYLGYPNTTGLQCMDYRITDAISDPPQEEDHLYSESLYRLPRHFLCFQPPDNAPDIGALPALERGYITFGSFNNFKKITEDVLAAWTGILVKVPAARLILKSQPLNDAMLRERVYDFFEQSGVDRRRINLFGWESTIGGHLDLYSQIDIALDTYPYNGTTTTCEALWMGVPVVAWRGDRHAARVSVSILTELGLGAWCAETPEDYVDLAVRHALDIEALASLRSQLRSLMQTSKLCDGRDMARTLESAYAAIWKRAVNAE